MISPCGNCRQLMRETDESNLEAEVILDEKDRFFKRTASLLRLVAGTAMNFLIVEY